MNNSQEKKHNRNIAIILAGGVGSRMGYSTPKQFYKVAGKTVIEHTIDAFESHSGIDEIAVVMNETCIDRMEDIILRNKWKKLKKLLKGGTERYMSTLSAIESYSNEEVNLIFHDAVRPLVSRRIIDDVINALSDHEAIDVAVPATDTIIEVNAIGDTISSIPPRALLRRGQTPQAFRMSIIKEAYRRAMQDPEFVSTDDCGTVIKYMPEVSVYVVQGEESNMKLTYKADSYLLDKLFQLKGTTVRDDADFSQLKGKVMVVFGGNSGIGEEIVKMAIENGAKVYSFSRSTTSTDIADAESVKKSIRDVAEKESRIDYVVNSAAILMKEPLMTMDSEAIKAIINTNYWGMVNVAMASYEWLKKSNGQLLLFTSSSYTRGRAFYSLYSSTKAAAVNFAQALAQEWDSDSIRINVINPERTKTPMRVKNFGVEPDNTLLKADDVAKVSLCTLLSDFTGQVVDVKIKKN